MNTLVEIPERKKVKWNWALVGKLLNLYLAGAHPIRLARILGTSPKAVNRMIERLRNNEKGLAERYKPLDRINRRGKRITENERYFIDYYRKEGIPMKHLVGILQRDLKEFATVEDFVRVDEMKQVGVGVDLILAYRYLYYCHGVSILSDEAYDKLEKEEMEFGAGGETLKEKVGSDNPVDYPERIRALALYLGFRYGKMKKK